MPRVADHDQRRTQIARAFQRLLAADGLAAVSFTRVAGEAGVSVGLIQHYFAGRDALLRFAYADAASRTSERVAERVRHGAAAGRPVGDVLLDSLLELVPLDPERMIEYRVRQSLQAQTGHHSELTEVAYRSGGDLLRSVAATIESGQAAGEVGPDVDPVLAGRMILATVQGVADQVALSGAEAFDAVRVLRPVVSLVFAGSPRSEETI